MSFVLFAVHMQRSSRHQGKALCSITCYFQDFCQLKTNAFIFFEFIYSSILNVLVVGMYFWLNIHVVLSGKRLEVILSMTQVVCISRQIYNYDFMCFRIHKIL